MCLIKKQILKRCAIKCQIFLQFFEVRKMSQYADVSTKKTIVKKGEQDTKKNDGLKKQPNFNHTAGSLWERTRIWLI